MRTRVAQASAPARASPRGGRPLATATRAAMESHFGHDFADVRVHTGADAAAAANEAGALAFTSGRDVVFGEGQYSDARLRHELAHVVQHARAARTVPGTSAPGDAHERDAERMARDGGPPRVAFAPPEVLRDARMPTLEQREQLMPIYNPEGAQAQPLVDPAGFRTEMTTRMNGVIDALLHNAQARQASSIDLTSAEIQSLGTIAWREIIARYGTHLQASVTGMTPAAVQQQITQRVHLVSDTPAADRPRVACNLVVNLMDARGEDIQDDHNVIANSHEAKTRGCSGGALPTPLPADQRDQALYESVQQSILQARRADLLLIVEFGPSYSEGQEAWIQTRLIQRTGESQDDAIRRGRWVTLGTVLHELLHVAAHSSSRTAFSGVEQTDIGVEGFAEYFAREVYDDLRRRASSDNALRLSIESRGTSWDEALAPDRGGYQTYINSVNDIRRILENNDDNLRAAYFAGRVEYLGLGNWAQPANVVGGAAYLTLQDPTHGFFDVHYGRVIFGRTGRFQITTGANVSFLTDGSRLGVGPDLSIRYSWPNVYVSAGVGAQVSGSLTQGYGQTVRLDVLPHVGAGVRIGVVRVGVNGMVLIPTVAAPAAERTVRGLVGIGVSGEF